MSEFGGGTHKARLCLAQFAPSAQKTARKWEGKRAEGRSVPSKAKCCEA